jgi:hypothetical protein
MSSYSDIAKPAKHYKKYKQISNHQQPNSIFLVATEKMVIDFSVIHDKHDSGICTISEAESRERTRTIVLSFFRNISSCENT